MPATIERRRFRRAELLEVSVTIRVLDAESKPGAAVTGQVKNVSLAGVYCLVPAGKLNQGDQVVCSLEVPVEQHRAFPFARLMGKGWVSRVDQVVTGRRAGERHVQGEQPVGAVIAFTPDVTPLGKIE